MSKESRIVIVIDVNLFAEHCSARCHMRSAIEVNALPFFFVL